jgi:alcohol dehydrogenase
MTSYKALWVEEKDGEFVPSIIQRDSSELTQAELLIEVQYSSLNYKDALSASGNKGVTRNFPHQPGIDAAGVVVQSNHGDFAIGQEVIVTGFDLGMNTAGGLGQMIAIPASWAVKKPAGITLAQSMLFGTAGLTAMLCVNKLLRMGLTVDKGDVLVTGATGGVGSIAVALLAAKGFNVVACSGKKEQHDYLKQLGAREVIDRAEHQLLDKKPLLKERFAAAIDVAGGVTLSNTLKQIKHGGSVAICGLVESPNFDTTVLPFILRGINLLGVDSVEISLAEKAAVWQSLAEYETYEVFEQLINEDIALEQVPDKLANILQGKTGKHYRVNMS